MKRLTEGMTWQERQGRTMCSVRSTKQLIVDFINTGYMNAPQVPTIRGWIMDELEKRDPVAYDEWLAGTADDHDLYKYFNVI